MSRSVVTYCSPTPTLPHKGEGASGAALVLKQTLKTQSLATGFDTHRQPSVGFATYPYWAG
jgi:hypothetical protein